MGIQHWNLLIMHPSSCLIVRRPRALMLLVEMSCGVWPVPQVTFFPKQETFAVLSSENSKNLWAQLWARVCTAKKRDNAAARWTVCGPVGLRRMRRPSASFSGSGSRRCIVVSSPKSGFHMRCAFGSGLMKPDNADCPRNFHGTS